MKKISTLILAGLMTMAVSAAERQPMVTVNNTSNNYEVMIDGQTYNNGNSATIPNMAQGTHRVEVYQVVKKLFAKQRTLVSSSNFELGNNDVTINVDQNGQLRINQAGNSTTRKNRGRTDNTWNNGRNRDQNGGVFNRGQGNEDDDIYEKEKKEKKAKKAKHNNGKHKGHYKNGKLGTNG